MFAGEVAYDSGETLQPIVVAGYFKSIAMLFDVIVELIGDECGLVM